MKKEAVLNSFSTVCHVYLLETVSISCQPTGNCFLSHVNLLERVIKKP